jgi:hypothetical protein
MRTAKNSPQKAEHQVLGILPEQSIKDFLVECANLPNPIDYPENRLHFERWLRRWRHVLAFKNDAESTWIRKEQLELLAPQLRSTLCRIWMEQDARQRDWYFYCLRDAYNRTLVLAENPGLLNPTDATAMKKFERISRARQDDAAQKARFLRELTGSDLFECVPRLSPLEAALYWLQCNQTLMVRCGGPVCAAPYFLRTTKGQKFCSPECADPARRQAKLRWWRESPNSPKNRTKKQG